jgi:hypothetical protein
MYVYILYAYGMTHFRFEPTNILNAFIYGLSFIV